MRRSTGGEVSIFNFAFLDILATTIGVILFIMVLALVDVGGRLSAEAVRERVRGLVAGTEGIREDVRRRREETDELWRTRQAYAEDPHAAGKDLAAQHDRQERLRAETRGLEDDERDLQRQVAELERELASLAATAAQRQARTTRTEVEFRVPRLRHTTKEQVVFECDGGRVYALAFAGRLAEANYTAMSVGGGGHGLIFRKGSAYGEDVHAAHRPRSGFANSVRLMDPQQHYATFVVRPDSFELFRQLRKAMWSHGFEVGWLPFREGQTVAAGPGGTGGAPQ